MLSYYTEGKPLWFLSQCPNAHGFQRKDQAAFANYKRTTYLSGTLYLMRGYSNVPSRLEHPVMWPTLKLQEVPAMNISLALMGSDTRREGGIRLGDEEERKGICQQSSCTTNPLLCVTCNDLREREREDKVICIFISRGCTILGFVCVVF